MLEKRSSEDASPMRVFSPSVPSVSRQVDLRGGRTYTVQKSIESPIGSPRSHNTESLNEKVRRQMWSSVLQAQEDVASAKVSVHQFLEQHLGEEQTGALAEVVSECVARRSSVEELTAKCVGVARECDAFVPLLMLYSALH